MFHFPSALCQCLFFSTADTPTLCGVVESFESFRVFPLVRPPTGRLTLWRPEICFVTSPPALPCSVQTDSFSLPPPVFFPDKQQVINHIRSVLAKDLPDLLILVEPFFAICSLSPTTLLPSFRTSLQAPLQVPVIFCWCGSDAIFTFSPCHVNPGHHLCFPTQVSFPSRSDFTFPPIRTTISNLSFRLNQLFKHASSSSVPSIFGPFFRLISLDRESLIGTSTSGPGSHFRQKQPSP